MPMFSMPDMPTPMTMLDDMTKQTRAMMPTEFASTVNLMAHPIAGAAALSAIGAGMAGHAIGLWLGAMSGATAASQRAFLQFAEAEAPDVDAFRDALRTPALRAGEAATALIADVGATEATQATMRRQTRKAKAPDAEAKPAVDPVPDVPAEAHVATPAPEVPPSAPVDADAANVAAAAPRRPAAIDRPDRADDLKAITGIGPKLEQVLNGMGIWTYAQIAGWDGAETAWLDDALGFPGRIGRDDWIGQAAKLSGKEG